MSSSRQHPARAQGSAARGRTAARELPSLSRVRCRRYCAERFECRRMARDYERIHRVLLDRASLADLALDELPSDAVSFIEMSE